MANLVKKKQKQRSQTSHICSVNMLVLKTYRCIQIHKMYESDVAQDQQQLLVGLLEVQIQTAHFLQPENQRSSLSMNFLCIAITTQRQSASAKIEVTCTITNFRLHFCTIFKNVSQAMSWKISRCKLQ
jgi:hypothetical protein